jgi:hypothetical protein
LLSILSMELLQLLKTNWRELEQDPPGERFQRRYRRQHAKGHGKKNPLRLAAGLIVVALGLFLMPAPGPGTIVVLLGGTLLSQESLLAARLLDRSEVLARKVLDGATRFWTRSSLSQRAAIILVAVAMIAGLGWAGYITFFH